MSVGRSGRTPAKHELMRSIVGREVGAAGAITAIDRLVWFDLTAGDGIPADGLEWDKNCSPGILAGHAAKSVKPVDLRLFEIKPATYDRLLASLAAQLPGLGYVQTDANVWTLGTLVVLSAVNASGATAAVDGIGRRDAVLAVNDPNAITDWAIRPSFAAELLGRTPWSRSLSTMGCNPAGLKRPPYEERVNWFDLIARQQSALPGYRDLLLAAIEGDDAQWAYLLCDPLRWRETQQRMAATAFAKHGYSLDMAWFRTARPAFEALKERLFLTKKERAA